MRCYNGHVLILKIDFPKTDKELAMKILGRVLLVLIIAASFGCQTTQGQSGGGAAPAASAAPAAASSSGDMLTDADYKRIGIKETEDLRK